MEGSLEVLESQHSIAMFRTLDTAGPLASSLPPTLVWGGRMNGNPGEVFHGIGSVPVLKKGDKYPYFKKVETFLQRFGYLDRAQHPSQGVLTEEVSDALERYQKLHALSVTGEFDEETRAQMTTSRCGMADPGSSLTYVTVCPWDRTNLTFSFTSGTSDVLGDEEFGAVRNAFETWALSTPLTFTEVSAGSNPDIAVGWHPTIAYDHDMTGDVVAHSDNPPDCSILDFGPPQPLHFDNGEQYWAIGEEPGAYDVESVALHEIGHLIGLDHSSNPAAVMFSQLNPNSIRRSLWPDDLIGALTLYPFQP
ncbi:matrixin family metalloprotease [Streptomyces sp. NPDC093094]|uniref:matrixin family metalloprotease n=1 Tax=Streptomyces sp. NPDC093094 TaxID=3366026 RepID=UPI00381B2E3E